MSEFESINTKPAMDSSDQSRNSEVVFFATSTTLKWQKNVRRYKIIQQAGISFNASMFNEV